jgi:hypothetical protein
MDVPITLVAHFDGAVSIDPYEKGAPITVVAAAQPSPPWELDIGEMGIAAPEFLAGTEVGLPAVLRDDAGGDKPLLLAAHGRSIDLRPERERIQTALAAGRPVEVHLYEHPQDAS